jgi:hypothetical protein
MCSPNCKTGSCDAQSGHCISGCKVNWTGDVCDSKFFKDISYYDFIPIINEKENIVGIK